MIDWTELGRDVATFIAEDGGVLLGTVVGGLISALTARGVAKRQRNWSIDDREASRREEREREVRARSDQKALELLDAIQSLEDLVQRRSSAVSLALWSRTEDATAARAMLRQIQLDSVFLPKLVRTHVVAIPLVLSDVDRLVGERFINDTPVMVARTTIDAGRRALGKHLRGEPPYSGLSSNVEGYMEAVQSLSDYLDHQSEAAGQ